MSPSGPSGPLVYLSPRLVRVCEIKKLKIREIPIWCGRKLFLAHRIRISDILLWDRNMLSYPGCHVRALYIHTGNCIRRFDGIYAYCRYFVDRKW